MSFIAAALAKSRGEAVRPPPPEDFADLPSHLGAGTPAFSLKPYPASTRQPKKSSRLLLWCAAGLLAAVGAGAWWFLRPPPPVPRPARRVFSEKMANTAAVAATGKEPIAPVPSDALTEKVQGLAVSAAVAGENQRIIVAGKVYLPGDKIAEGLVLQEVYPGLIVFRDDAGALYTRRY